MIFFNLYHIKFCVFLYINQYCIYVMFNFVLLNNTNEVYFFIQIISQYPYIIFQKYILISEILAKYCSLHWWRLIIKIRSNYKFRKMGGEESQPKGQNSQTPQNQIHPTQQNPQQRQQYQQHDAKQQLEAIQQTKEYDGIHPLHPLLTRVLMKEQFPQDIRIDSANLPRTHQMLKQHIANLNSTIAQNQDRITAQTKKQLEDYILLAGLLEKRQNELDSRLTKILILFRQFEDDVKTTTDLLKNTIEKADEIAAQIDPNLNFKNFQ
ncbi:hypothetical protein TRFO_01710 [Tritrichomonas foetus]|uniref:Uncharacterized protein n=1 Tax=Tritrichomonas foetus TaxID=1144522 RepID=A0A1J4JUB8_9EUKA|nr:hypothetical protein TRFO_01710 [Tritrichomonas foetus]|eukprot:OHT01118.1 hypothetical protein TRFO_01710 [Tritrichomonas foetus]